MGVDDDIKTVLTIVVYVIVFGALASLGGIATIISNQMISALMIFLAIFLAVPTGAFLVFKFLEAMNKNNWSSVSYRI